MELMGFKKLVCGVERMELIQKLVYGAQKLNPPINGGSSELLKSVSLQHFRKSVFPNISELGKQNINH